MKKCTRKHICEAIAYWRKQLKALNESLDTSLDDEFSNYTEVDYDNPPVILTIAMTGYQNGDSSASFTNLDKCAAKIAGCLKGYASDSITYNPGLKIYGKITHGYATDKGQPEWSDVADFDYVKFAEKIMNYLMSSEGHDQGATISFSNEDAYFFQLQIIHDSFIEVDYN
jgi:hypothetical protein